MALLLLAPAARGDDADPPVRQVRKLEWHGVENTATDELEDAILTTKRDWKPWPWGESRPFDAGTLEQDVARLRRFYRLRGFYETQVRTEVIEDGDGPVIVRFHVDEGPTIRLETFDIALVDEGVPEAPLDVGELRRELALVAGEPFSAQRYEQSKQVLRERLARQAYPQPAISGGAEVDLERGAARVAWSIAPGPYVRLGEPVVVGLERVASDLVLGEVQWEPGTPFDPQLLRSTQRAIFELGLFRSVSVVPVPPETALGEPPAVEQTWGLDIRVQERALRAFRVAGGFGTEDLLRVRIEWKHRNFLGGLRRLRIGGKYSFLERGGEIVFEQPRFLDRETDLTLDGFISQETQPAFDTDGISSGWRLERPLVERWKGRIGQRFEWRRVTDVGADGTFVEVNEEESFRLHFFQLGLRRSSLDSELDPTRGSWLDLSVEPSFASLASDVGYVRLLADARRFFPLGELAVLATRVRLGTVEPLEDDTTTEIPIFKRLFSGGSTSVRGFDLDGLGPLDADEEPLGGLTLAEGSVEVRVPIWRELGAVGFVDAGQVALAPFDLRGDDFFYSAGAGVRYRTPIGPLRLDAAKVLNPPAGTSGFRIHFSVGHAF